MKWIEAYATGVKRLDEHHKTIFQTAEDFRSALDEGEGEKTYGMLLNILHLYCHGHFGFEERCMDEHRCPVAGRNKQAHAGFMKVLEGYRENHAANGFDAVDARALVDAVDEWLDGHICRIDVQLRDYVE